MSTWGDFEREAASFAESVRKRFLAHQHHILGTIGRDGGPRLHGISVGFSHGEMWFGCMPRSMKVADIRRDPRVAFHSAPLDPDLSHGDCRVLGRAIPISETVVQERQLSTVQGEYFSVEIERVHLVEVVGEQLRLTTWKSERGLRIVERQ